MSTHTPLVHVAKEEPSAEHFRLVLLQTDPVLPVAGDDDADVKGVATEEGRGCLSVLIDDADEVNLEEEVLRVVDEGVPTLVVTPILVLATEEAVLEFVELCKDGVTGEEEGPELLPPVELPVLDFNVTLLVSPANLSPLQSASCRASLPGVCPAHLPPYSTESPGLGKTTSSPSTVLQLPAPKMLAWKMRGRVSGAVEELSTLTAAQFW